MDRWLLRQGLSAGLIGAAIAVVGWALEDDRTPASLLIRLGVFVVVFTAMGMGQAHDRRQRDVGLIGSVDPDAWYPVHEALASGVLPEDPALDGGVRRMVDDRLARLRRERRWMLVAWPVAAIGCLVGGAVGDDQWFLLAAAIVVVAPIGWRRDHRKLQRLDALDAALRARAGSVGRPAG